MLKVGDYAQSFEVRPVSGLPVRSPAPGQRPLALFFVRPLGCPLGRAALAQLQAAAPRLDDQGLRVLAVTPSPLDEARDYVPRHHLLFPVYADPQGELFDRFGLSSIGGLMSLGPRGLARVASEAIQRGAGALHGQGGRPSATLLLAPDGRVLFASAGLGDPPDVEATLQQGAA